MSLKRQAFKATLWSGLDIFLRQGVQFITSIFLARLIAPEQFGVMALLMVFTGIAGVFADSGFAAALIQKKAATRIDESTVFWINAGFGAGVSLALCAAAPFIAIFFDQPILVSATRFAAVTIIISSLGSIHFTLLEKSLKFKPQVVAGSLSVLASGAVAVVLALSGHGIWALVWQQVVATLVSTVVIWILHPWRPMLAFSRESARSLFGFGGFILATNLFEAIYQRFYALLIGKFFGVRELGFYNRAASTQQLPAGILTTLLMRVAFPVFSATNDDMGRLLRGTRHASRSAILVNAPVFLGLAAVAEPLVVTLFGERWMPAVPTLQILCIAGLLWPLQRINLTVLVAQGWAKQFFKLEMLNKILGVAAILIGAIFGVDGVAWATVVASVVSFVITAHYVGRHLGYGVVAQVLDALPFILIAAMMALAVHGLGMLWQPSVYVALLGKICFGVVFMCGAVLALKPEIVREGLGMLKGNGVVS